MHLLFNMICLPIFLFFSSGLLSAQEKPASLTINTGFPYPEAGVLKTMSQELLDRNQIKLNFQVLPNQRALLNANSGEDDGEAARIYELTRYYENLFPTEESIHTIEVVLISKRPVHLKRDDNFNSLHVGVIRGMKIAEMVALQNQPKSLIKATRSDSLLNMLKHGRIDIALVDKISLLSSLQKNHQEASYYMFDPPYIQRKLYFQLHKKHRHLLPQLTKTLQEMKRDGRFAEIREKFYQQFEHTIKKSVKIIPYEN